MHRISGREGVRSVGSSLGSCLSLLLCSNMLPGSSRTGLGFTFCSPPRTAIIATIPESNQRERKCRGSRPHPVGRISCWISERRWPHEQSPEGRPAALGWHLPFSRTDASFTWLSKAHKGRFREREGYAQCDTLV